MLLAQASEITSWVQIVVQLGALGILGVFFLKVQPILAEADRKARMEEIRLIVSIFVGEREAFAERAGGIEDEVKRFRGSSLCRYPLLAGDKIRNIDLGHKGDKPDGPAGK